MGIMQIRRKDEDLYKRLMIKGYSHSFSDSISNVIVETGRVYNGEPVAHNSWNGRPKPDEPVVWLSEGWRESVLHLAPLP